MAKYEPQQIEKALRLWAEGNPWKDVTRKSGVPRAALNYYVVKSKKKDFRPEDERKMIIERIDVVIGLLQACKKGLDVMPQLLRAVKELER